LVLRTRYPGLTGEPTGNDSELISQRQAFANQALDLALRAAITHIRWLAAARITLVLIANDESCSKASGGGPFRQFPWSRMGIFNTGDVFLASGRASQFSLACSTTQDPYFLFDGRGQLLERNPSRNQTYRDLEIGGKARIKNAGGVQVVPLVGLRGRITKAVGRQNLMRVETSSAANGSHRKS